MLGELVGFGVVAFVVVLVLLRRGIEP